VAQLGDEVAQCLDLVAKLGDFVAKWGDIMALLEICGEFVEELVAQLGDLVT
jgi:hypothetical protein